MRKVNASLSTHGVKVFVDRAGRRWYNEPVKRNSRRDERMGIMAKEELVNQIIEEYTKIQRIIKAPDQQKEIENQKRILEAKLQAFGVVTEKLEID